jgi:integrase
MSIQKRVRSGRIEYRVFVRDGAGDWFKPVRGFETKLAAREFEAELIARRNRGGQDTGRSARELTLDQYWETWKVVGRLKTSKGWRSSQDQMYRDHIKPLLGASAFVDIDHEEIAKFLATLDDKGLGGQTRLHVYNLLHKMFKNAIPKHRESNPVLLEYRPEKPKVVRPYFKSVDAMKFLDSVATHKHGPAMWVMTICGLRTGEMQVLRVGDLCIWDADEPHLVIREQWVRKEKVFGPVKNGQPIRVPVPEMLAAYLRARFPKGTDPTAFIVQGRKPGQHASNRVIYDAVTSLTQAAGLKRLSPHELRHSCAELWKDIGATTKDLQVLFNHASEASVKAYDHKVDDRLRRLSGKFSGEIRGGLSLVKK